MEKNKEKTISVRLTDDVVVQLETLARFDGVAIAQEIRQGIVLLLAAKKQDPEFRERVKTVLDDAKRLLAEIGEEDVAEALGPTPAMDKKKARERVAVGAGAPSTV
jgi:Arc/MetJ-type ribon-helix-helix transcriptional regulator